MAKKIDARKALIQTVYEARRDRNVNPEGSFDDAGRWYPSDREDADGSGSSTRTPSRAWPYSYLLRCRTRAHVTVLINRALAGKNVPADISRALEATLPETTNTNVAQN